MWDTCLGDRSGLPRIIADCGARVEYLAPPFATNVPRGTPSLLTMTRNGTADPLTVIRILKEKDLEICAISTDGYGTSLTERCQALLAGAAILLDANGGDFPNQLRNWIQSKLRAQYLQTEELERIGTLMREMHIVGNSGPLLNAFRLLQKVSALSDVPVLISGESGTGKELFAHALQKLDPKRSRGAFVSLNCAAISAQLVESELFGHRKGSFTGAEHHRKGLIRSAEGGTLFLDEVGELEIGLQAKMLRVLQEKRVLGVGEDAEVPVDIRVIAATNRSLEQMVKAGTFREDLYHRLNVVNVHIPPLRERTQDVALLIDHFLRKYSNIARGADFPVSRDFVNALSRLELRGNARELENIIRQVLLNKSDTNELSLLDLPQDVWRGVIAVDTPGPQAAVAADREVQNGDISEQTIRVQEVFRQLLESGASLSATLQRCEKILLEAALRRAKGNQSQTARILGITPRSVYNKLRRHNLAA